ncbi:MAG: hypothetical protein ACK4FK_13845 [Ferrovibrio sp.]|uniref:hypothetical protein n=1 Tax=Ferrovibrio sp. TaxID=1917215 RepID=UPI00391871C9
MLIHDWTIDPAARIVENEDFVVSLYDRADGDYGVAHIRPKHAAPGGLIAANDTVAREARVAFTLAMRQRQAAGL